MSLPLYILPSQRDPVSYSAQLRSFNRRLQEEFSRQLEVIDLEYEDSALYTTGSDGRLEKGPVSTLEFLLLIEGRTGKRKAAPLIEQLRAFKPKLTDGSVEVKVIGRDNMNRFNNRYDRTYPQRILDLAYLAGKKGIEESAKLKLAREWIGKRGRNIDGSIKRKLRDFQTISNTGKDIITFGYELVQYDLELGLAFYDPQLKQSSFKFGPLRYVQFAIIKDLVKYYRQSIRTEEESELITRLPANTQDKIHYLEAEGLLNISPNQAVELVNSYNYFLWMFHQAQEKYETNGLKEQMFDIKEVKERLKGIDSIISNGLLKTEKIKIVSFDFPK
ncbi:hypothetical protein HYU21_01040 [Candidatus Woesearchaeota archaeon]|nr:hypothetical protein [Candidatus Woesearchaeota archaeon]